MDAFVSEFFNVDVMLKVLPLILPAPRGAVADARANRFLSIVSAAGVVDLYIFGTSLCRDKA
jgi:hypothetical protein